MSETHTPLFTLPDIIADKDTAVFISGGYLYKDSSSDSKKACLNVKNVSGKEIKSLQFRLQPLDKDGNDIDFENEYVRSGPFSDETLELKDILLPFITASFKTDLERAVFSDGSTLDLQKRPVIAEAADKKPDADTSASPDRESSEHDTSVKAEKTSVEVSPAKTDTDTSEAENAITDKEAAPVKDDDSGIEEQKVQKAGSGKRSVLKTLILVLIPAVLILSGLAIIFVGAYIPERRYAKAVELFNAGQLNTAISAFEQMNGYKDSAAYISTAETILAYQAAAAAFDAGDYETAYKDFSALRGFGDSAERAAIAMDQIRVIAYGEADSLLRKGKLLDAANAFYQMKDYSDSWDRCFDAWGRITDRKTISAGSHTVCLTDDGNILTAGGNDDGELNVDSWDNIRDISAGNGFTVGLRPDGTVVAAGNNDYGQCDVEDWKDIVSVYAGYWSTVGIKADGTVMLAGRDCDVSWWKNIKAVDSSIFHTVGLLTDGTVVAAETKDISGATHNYGQFDVSGWNNITAVSTGVSFTVGLRRDGTVVAVGDNTYGQCDVGDWENIVAISANGWHVVGLKSDGTVVAAGWNENGECDVEDWENIIAVSTGTAHTIGLKADGTLVAVGNDRDGRCDVEDWNNIRTR